MVAKAPIGLAVVGGRRGKAFNQALALFPDKVQLKAVCDLDTGVLHQWKEQHPEITTYASYDRMLDDPEIDAVFLATPLQIHAKQAVQGLRAGKHIMSEVIAAHTLEDCWQLVETVEKTGHIYMMAENYCFMRPNMMVKNMVQKGLFGDITHIEGAYIHDCRNLTHDSDGGLTWRGKLLRDYNCMNYPTHSLGPVAQWLGINKEGGDRFETMSTHVSEAAAAQKHFQKHFGPDHPGARRDFWRQGDSAVSTIRTEQGALVVLRVDWLSARPHNMTHYALQGTSGAYLSPRYSGEDPLIWIEDQSPGRSPAVAGQEAEWQSLWLYSGDYEHPLWRQWKTEAEKTGHGGGDLFVLHEFVSAILDDRQPVINVYDAVTWSSVFPLSAQSVASGGKPVTFPNFRERSM